ncbi:MAG: TetR/AcrR family transcriptional regulator [Anaerolineae bacterium]|nr:TetR/AcrR family transcriptional regulator [Anaerolineae bacterium]
MPYPAKVTLTTIVEHARTMIETEGIEALSLNKLAAALGIKAPSLYRHVASKTALLRAVNTDTMQALVTAINQAVEQVDPTDTRARLMALALAYRAFAHDNPITYDLAFTNTIPDLQVDAAEAEQLVLPLQALMAAWVGEEKALAALRGAMALVHGFAMLEINGQLRRGGDLNQAFEQSFAAFLAGWR